MAPKLLEKCNPVYHLLLIILYIYIYIYIYIDVFGEPPVASDEKVHSYIYIHICHQISFIRNYDAMLSNKIELDK